MSPDGADVRAGNLSASPRSVLVLEPPALSGRALLGGLRALWEYRDLFVTFSIHRVKVRYRQTVLGVSWALLQPLALMLLYTLIFSRVAGLPSEGLPYPVFVYAALVPWTFFASTLTNASHALVSHSDLVTKVYFPREILPLTYVAAFLFDAVIASIVLAGLMAHAGLALTPAALYVLPIGAVLILFAIGMALILSATQARFRDIGVAVPLLLQIWLFATPVVYPLSAVPPAVRGLYALNPMVGLIDGGRQALLHGRVPDLGFLALSTVVTLGLLPVAYLYFTRTAATMADVV